jgi:hypothetical protein
MSPAFRRQGHVCGPCPRYVHPLLPTLCCFDGSYLLCHTGLHERVATSRPQCFSLSSNTNLIASSNSYQSYQDIPSSIYAHNRTPLKKPLHKQTRANINMQYTTALILAITGFATAQPTSTSSAATSAQSTTTSSAATPSVYGSVSGCNPSIDKYVRYPLSQSKAVSNKGATDSSPSAL